MYKNLDKNKISCRVEAVTDVEEMFYTEGSLAERTCVDFQLQHVPTSAVRFPALPSTGGPSAFSFARLCSGALHSDGLSRASVLPLVAWPSPGRQSC